MQDPGAIRSNLRYKPDSMIPKSVGLAGHPYFIPLLVQNHSDNSLAPVTAVGPSYIAPKIN